MTHVYVIGFGMSPQHLTREAVDALSRVSYVLAARKGPDDELLEARRRICAEFGVELVDVPDPERDRDDPSDYAGAVDAWHLARAKRYAAELRARGGVAAFLVWGDPALYDSTLRILDRAASSAELTWEVIPGISAPQILAARHRLVLHEVGRATHLTTARRLEEALKQGQTNIVVMLGSGPSLDRLAAVPDWHIWWGANLGAASERLVAGRVGDVLGDVRQAREASRVEAGWVMDTYLLRAPHAEQAS